MAANLGRWNFKSPKALHSITMAMARGLGFKHEATVQLRRRVRSATRAPKRTLNHWWASDLTTSHPLEPRSRPAGHQPPRRLQDAFKMPSRYSRSDPFRTAKDILQANLDNFISVAHISTCSGPNLTSQCLFCSTHEARRPENISPSGSSPLWKYHPAYLPIRVQPPLKVQSRIPAHQGPALLKYTPANPLGCRAPIRLGIPP
eukprot:1175740-Prorocentrum_minimum.AAC.2